MADCSAAFASFHQAISLTKTEKRFLRSARSAITKKLIAFFASRERCPKIEFKVQGSFSMGTIVRPLDGDFDIDIGIYLLNYGNWQHNWPKPEAVSQWLVTALSGHTSLQPVNKRNCVRIHYKPRAGTKNFIGYHVDLPIYIEYESFFGKYTRIGITGEKQWNHKSDPIGFTKWFFEESQKNKGDVNQLTRLVKYIKAWKDYSSNGTKFPSGMALTILMAKQYQPHKRDDVAFALTIKEAWAILYGFFGLETITSPVVPHNNLLSRLTRNQKDNFQAALTRLKDLSGKAVNTENAIEAMECWQQCFGSRMPFTT